MHRSGIDTSVFTPHSTRSAVVSKAKMMGVQTDVILSRCAWKGEHCFAKYYLKPIEGKRQPLGQAKQFQSAILGLPTDPPSDEDE